jgi:hypothetical protein
MRYHRAARALVPVAVLLGVAALLPACTSEPATVTEVLTIGTFNLAPVGTSGSDSESFSANVARPAPGRDLMVKAMRFFVTDAAGRELSLEQDAIHLHHVVMMSSKAADSTCPTSGYPSIGGQRFAASGNEKSPITFLPGWAYHVRAADQWRAVWHLMNMGPTRLDGVKLAYEITYFQGTPTQTTRDLKPYYLDVAGCTSVDFDLPGGGAAGSVVTKSATFTMPDTGRAVYTLGHLHDGGIDVSFNDPSGNAHCTATATYGHDHAMPGMGAHITRMTLCPTPFDIHAGQAWQVHARYPGDVAYKDVMGVIFTYVVL